MHRLLSILILAAGTAAAAEPATIWKAKQIRWQQTNADGSKYAVLEGGRSRPGVFTYAFFLPAGVWVAPHTHSAAARVTVVSGTLLLGAGDDVGKSQARAIPAGGFFLVPANSSHWEGAKGDTLIIGVGSGPWVTTYIGK